MRILLADDDAVSRKVLRAHLESLGHEVTDRGGGPEAWTDYDRNPFPVVISDWLMPEIDGLELCRRIRDRGRTDYTYFILMTVAHEGRDQTVRVLAGGADDFLPKPVDLDLLGARLQVAERVLNLETKVKQLQGFLPICSFCKRIRNDKEVYERLETYIERHSGATFSHTYCPDCIAKHFPQRR